MGSTSCWVRGGHRSPGAGKQQPDSHEQGGVRDIGLAVVSFASVVMAWYGVNFVLGAGLHSYVRTRMN